MSYSSKVLEIRDFINTNLPSYNKYYQDNIDTSDDFFINFIFRFIGSHEQRSLKCNANTLFKQDILIESEIYLLQDSSRAITDMFNAIEDVQNLFTDNILPSKLYLLDITTSNNTTSDINNKIYHKYNVNILLSYNLVK